MSSRTRRSLLIVGCIVILTMLACSFGSNTTATSPSGKSENTPSSGESATPTTKESSSTAGSLEDVQKATIQIIGEGTFAEPEGTAYNVFGAGSGFIIDPSGIAVTNNHVVTGAALLKVYIGGNTDKAYNAKVLGASECSDLAVIQIQGSSFPYLKWYSGEPKVGLDVYAAGFPLGEPQYTLTRGIVSKSGADGITDWASVQNVLMHDATINPGNSGGPLVTKDGEVVGINYAGNQANQYFAITKDEANNVINDLKSGKDVTSIGVNGRAFVTQDGTLSGIWVSSVKSGSPADKAGIKPADIITQMEGLVLATNGTMSEYCDILRSHDTTSTLSIQVYRTGTQTTLEGQLNGRELVETFQAARQEAQNTYGNTTSDSYSSFTTTHDSKDVLTIDIPNEWSDIKNGDWKFQNDRKVGPIIKAAKDLNAWDNTWTESGVFFGASAILAKEYTPDSYLDSDNFSNYCKYKGRQDYSDAVFVGKYDYYEKCDGKDTFFINLAVTTTHYAPDLPNVFVLIQVIVTKNADFSALDKILATFDIINPSGLANWTAGN